jgi:predicted metal-dependent HD superfamily phosphohydrolase
MKKQSFNDVFTQLSNHVQQKVFPHLPRHLYYHNSDHTIKDVLPAAIHLAKEENINDHDFFILKVAVLFHDTGFIEQYPNNEEIGARIAGETLPDFHIGRKDINRIQNIILATRVSTDHNAFLQMAGDDILEKIMCDADVDNLGRDDFFEKSGDLRKEMGYFGRKVNDQEWNDYQAFILKTHRFLTPSAIRFRENGQRKNLSNLGTP